jgi:hypothetical protein
VPCRAVLCCAVLFLLMPCLQLRDQPSVLPDDPVDDPALPPPCSDTCCLLWRGAEPFHAVLCCAVLCCAVLCCAVLCCAVLCCAVLCCAMSWPQVRSRSSLMSDQPLALLCPHHLSQGASPGSLIGDPHITCVMYSKQGELLASYNDEVRGWLCNTHML